MPARSTKVAAIAFVFLAGCTATVPDRTAGGPPRARVPTNLEVRDAVDPGAAARAAVVLASCTFDAPAEHHLVEMFERVYPGDAPEEAAALAGCVDRARGGCGALDTCLAMKVDDAPRETRCIDNVAQTWFGRATVRVDCTRLGRTCAVTGAIAECVDAKTEACQEDVSARCSADGRPVGCRGGHASLGSACGPLGLGCLEGSTIAYCAGTEGSCSNASPASGGHVTFEGEACDGERLVACVGGGRASVDCGTLVTGATCRLAGGEAFCGLGEACVPGKPAAATCDGDAVLVCNGGRIDRVDCKELGFATCTTTSGVFGEPYARCS